MVWSLLNYKLRGCHARVGLFYCLSDTLFETVSRINSNGNYEPYNCRWVTLSENVRQKYQSDFITVGDKSLTIHDWSKRLNLPQYTLRNRYKEFGKKWVEEAIKTILETDDNSHIYKRKGYANGRIKHRKNTNTKQ